MPLVIQKYGGSSLATPAHIRRAAMRIGAVRASGTDVVVVVSAMGRMTDHLINLARRTVQRPPQREMDMLLTAGERVSMSLMAMALQNLGIPAISFTGSQSGIITTNQHSEARILEIRPTRIQEVLAQGKVAIVAGFQGVSREREVTTLGRGGSDTTAVALAAALGAVRCDVLTDVDGIMTADPRLVPHARLIPECSYEEAIEFSSLGAKMHARSLDVARRFGVLVRVASSSSDSTTGTCISKSSPRRNDMENTVIRGIGSKSGHCYFNISQSLEEVLPLLANAQLPLRCFTAGTGTVELVSDDERAESLKDSLDAKKIHYDLHRSVSIVSVVGDGICGSVDLLPRFLGTLHSKGIPCLMVSQSSLSIVAAIPSGLLSAATQILHQEFLEGQLGKPAKQAIHVSEIAPSPIP